MTEADCPGDGIDWIEAWRCASKRHRSSRGYDDGRHLWSRDENARRYDASSRDEYAPRVAETIAGLPLTPGSRILDIGAGPGTLALPIAPCVREVVAVEPAEGMVAVLEEHLARNGINNIRTVRKRWEDIDPARDLDGEFELVLASFSITMDEIGEALDAPVIKGETSVTERERLFNAFRSGEITLLVVSKVANFSVDLPSATVAIQVSGSFGSRASALPLMR